MFRDDAVVRVREATEADTSVVAALNTDVQRLHFEREPGRFRPPDAASVEPVIRGWLERLDDVKVFIAEDADGTATGYAVAIVERRAENPFTRETKFVELDQIAVLPAHRRRGVGRLLTLRVLQFAADLGIDRVELTTWEFNRDAKTFFASLGFVPSSRRMAATTARP